MYQVSGTRYIMVQQQYVAVRYSSRWSARELIFFKFAICFVYTSTWYGGADVPWITVSDMTGMYIIAAAPREPAPREAMTTELLLCLPQGRNSRPYDIKTAPCGRKSDKTIGPNRKQGKPNLIAHKSGKHTTLSTIALSGLVLVF